MSNQLPGSVRESQPLTLPGNYRSDWVEEVSMKEHVYAECEYWLCMHIPTNWTIYRPFEHPPTPSRPTFQAGCQIAPTNRRLPCHGLPKTVELHSWRNPQGDGEVGQSSDCQWGRLHSDQPHWLKPTGPWPVLRSHESYFCIIWLMNSRSYKVWPACRYSRIQTQKNVLVQNTMLLQPITCNPHL